MRARRRSCSTGPPSGARPSARRSTGAGTSRPSRTPSRTSTSSSRRTVRPKGRVLEITGTWRRLADAVPAADYARVRDDIDRVRDLMQYDVDIGGKRQPATAARQLASALALILLGFTFCPRVVGRVGRQRNSAACAPPATSPRIRIPRHDHNVRHPRTHERRQPRRDLRRQFPGIRARLERPGRCEAVAGRSHPRRQCARCARFPRTVRVATHFAASGPDGARAARAEQGLLHDRLVRP